MNQRFAHVEQAASYLDWRGSLPLAGTKSQRSVSLQTVYRGLLLVLSLARKARTSDFTLSVRQLADLGVGDAGEASRVLRALRQLGFLDRLGRRQKEGTRYRLLLPSAPPLPVRSTPVPTVIGDLATDGARKLKLTSMQILSLKAANPKMKTAEIARTLGISVRAAQRAYKRVRDLPSTAFDETSVADKLRARHEIDRRDYNRLVAAQKDARLAQAQRPRAQPQRVPAHTQSHPQSSQVRTSAGDSQRRPYRPVVPPAVTRAPERHRFKARVDEIVTVNPYDGTLAVDLADVSDDNKTMTFSMTRVNYSKQLRDAGIGVGDWIVFSAIIRQGDYERRLRYIKDVRVVPRQGAVLGTRTSGTRGRRRNMAAGSVRRVAP